MTLRPRPGRLSRLGRLGRLAAVVALATLAVTACGGEADRDSSAEGPAGRRVVHAAGTTTVPAEIGRVVALDQPAALGALSLGVRPARVLAGFQAQPVADEILAGYDIATEPYSLAQPSLERVARARPDLIIGSGHPRTIAAYDQYTAIAPTVVVPFSTDWRDQLSVTAAALGRRDQAEALAARIDRQARQLRDAIAGRGLDGTSVSVIGSIRGEPFAFPNSGPAGRLLAQLGLTRPPAQDVEVASDQGFVTFSTERLPDHDADVLVTVTGAVYDTEETITRSPLYRRLDAVEQDRVYRASGDVWLGAAPFAAAWILDDLSHILLDHEQAPATPVFERWRTLITAD